MIQKLKQSVMVVVLVFTVCLMFPSTSKAAAVITGGDSLESAVKVNMETQYTTIGTSGWFKIVTPENVDYIGVGADQFTNVSVYDDAENWIGISTRFQMGSVKEQALWKDGTTYYRDYNSEEYTRITGNTCYYLYISTSKAENCNFSVICSTACEKENAETINMNSDYSHMFYVAYQPVKTQFSHWYKFVASTTGYYKAILKTSAGSADCTVEYKDGTEICSVECSKSESGEEIFYVTKGMTYYINVHPDDPAMVTLHVSNVRVSSIVLNASSLELDANNASREGEQFLLEPTIAPSTAVIQTVTYSSSNPSVATVSQDGWVTAIQSGTAVITVAADDGSGVKQVCSVRVRESMYSGQKATVGGIKYKVTSNTSKGGKASVYGISNKKISSCIIPATVEMKGYIYKVEGIDSNAFANCSKLKKIKGASNITSIGSKAFYKCVKLTTIGSKNNTVLLSNVKTIGNSAFYGCKAIKTVNISSGALTKIGDSAFYGCTSMTNFTAKSTKLSSLGKKAFGENKKLSSVTFKTSKLTKAKIGANAFKGIKSTCTFKVPSKSVKSYQKIFVLKGAGNKIKVKKG